MIGANDFIVTDDGRPREIRIFSGEIDANDATPQPELTTLPPGVYSNRFGLRDARIATALAPMFTSRNSTTLDIAQALNWDTTLAEAQPRPDIAAA